MMPKRLSFWNAMGLDVSSVEGELRMGSKSLLDMPFQREEVGNST